MLHAHRVHSAVEPPSTDAIDLEFHDKLERNAASESLIDAIGELVLEAGGGEMNTVEKLRRFMSVIPTAVRVRANSVRTPEAREEKPVSVLRTRQYLHAPRFRFNYTFNVV